MAGGSAIEGVGSHGPRTLAGKRVEPMLAEQVPSLPDEGFLYEPKWDGFRCLVFREGDWIGLRSRNDKSLDDIGDERIRESLLSLPRDSFVLDGELLGFSQEGGLSFRSVTTLRGDRGKPGVLPVLVLFDIVFEDDTDLRGMPLRQRRVLLEDLLEQASLPLFLSPITEDHAEATKWLERSFGHGVDGIVAKDPESRYLSGKIGWSKFRWSKTADCVVAGLRRNRGEVVSLLLGLFQPDGVLRYVGAVSGFSGAEQVALDAELGGRTLSKDVEHPWSVGPEKTRIEAGGRDWVPIEPGLVCEVEFSMVEDGRFRHPPAFVTWRFDKEPENCTLDQLES